MDPSVSPRKVPKWFPCRFLISKKFDLFLKQNKTVHIDNVNTINNPWIIILILFWSIFFIFFSSQTLIDWPSAPFLMWWAIVRQGSHTSDFLLIYLIFCSKNRVSAMCLFQYTMKNIKIRKLSSLLSASLTSSMRGRGKKNPYVIRVQIF